MDLNWIHSYTWDRNLSISRYFSIIPKYHAMWGPWVLNFGFLTVPSIQFIQYIGFQWYWDKLQYMPTEKVKGISNMLVWAVQYLLHPEILPLFSICFSCLVGRFAKWCCLHRQIFLELKSARSAPHSSSPLTEDCYSSPHMCVCSVQCAWLKSCQHSSRLKHTSNHCALDFVVLAAHSWHLEIKEIK